MSSRLDRFKERSELRKKLHINSHLHEVMPPEKINKLLSEDIDNDVLNNSLINNSLTYNLDVSEAEAEELITELSNAFDQYRYDELMTSAKNNTIKTIASAFGVGHLISAYDKIGGNVDTIHNVRNSIYATENEESKYENREEYNPDEYHATKEYINKNRDISEQKDNGVLVDSYTKNTVKINDKIDLDHNVSAKEISDDPARVLAELDGPELANIKDNLHPTARSINRSKGKKTTEEFIEYLDKTKQERSNKIDELLKIKEPTDKQRKELSKLQELEKVNTNEMRKIDKFAREKQDSIINKEYYTSTKFVKSTAQTSVNEGVKMGVQQAIGIITVEFFTNVFYEIKDAYNTRLNPDSIIDEIKQRIYRVGKNIAAKWKEIMTDFKDGFISGFISNLVTTIINAFVTTGKRIVRMIREGIFSIFRALKTLIFPPEGLSFTQAAHESLKLLLVGGVVIGGIALEEIVHKYLLTIPVLNLMAGALSTAIVGAITGIVSTLVAYFVDKLDLFHTIEIQRNSYVLKELNIRIDYKIEKIEDVIRDLELPIN